MKIYSVITLLVALSVSNLWSQDTVVFIFRADAKALDISEVDPSKVDEHIFGSTIEKKMVLFNERYTKVIPASPTSPSERIDILKPGIYNSISRLNKYFVSSVKKNTIEKDSARIQFEKYLDISLKVHNKNTTELEKALKKVKEPDIIMGILDKVVFE